MFIVDDLCYLLYGSTGGVVSANSVGVVLSILSPVGVNPNRSRESWWTNSFSNLGLLLVLLLMVECTVFCHTVTKSSGAVYSEMKTLLWVLMVRTQSQK